MRLRGCLAPLLFSLVGCTLPGCASNPKPVEAPPTAVEPQPDPAPARPVALRNEAKSKAPKAGAHDGFLVKTQQGVWAVRRVALQRLQREGAQSFIQKVRVRPAFARGRFVGWRVLAYGGPGALERGDVVTRVNGASIERPEQFMKVWEEMAQRSQLQVGILRQGRRLEARWPIVD